MIVVNRKTEPATRQAVLVITFTPSPTVRNLSPRRTGPVRPSVRQKLQHATKSRRFYKKEDNGRERATSKRSTSIHELKRVSTCNRCDALGLQEDECPQKRTPEIITERSLDLKRKVQKTIKLRKKGTPKGQGKAKDKRSESYV